MADVDPDDLPKGEHEYVGDGGATFVINADDMDWNRREIFANQLSKGELKPVDELEPELDPDDRPMESPSAGEPEPAESKPAAKPAAKRAAKKVDEA